MADDPETPPAADVEPPSGDGPPPEAAPPKLDITTSGLATSGPIDLREDAPAKEKLRLQEVPQHSLEWAKVVKPFTWFLFILISVVMLMPFVFLAAFLLAYKSAGLPVAEAQKFVLEWSHTILPPVVGFGGAIVGYYFGTRNASGTSSPPEDGGEEAG